MDKPRVYSYLRFSDPRQAAGSSAARQLDYAQRWATERGLQLDTALTLRDEGLSAYHQAHVTRGALGVFLAAIEAGQVAAGSVLIVEGLDRLSRAEPIQAQGQLAQIINAGVTVVTASDGREYNRARLKAQPMDLVYSLLVMIRAHEESDTKSKRVRAAIRRQCQQWVAGTYRGQVRVGTDPAWVAWVGDRFDLIPDRAEAVRLAIARFRRGDGAYRIARAMSERGLDMVGSNIYRTLRVPALRGCKRLTVEGEQFDLEEYYPRLLSDDEFSELQHLLGQRGRRRGRGEIPGIVTGLGITCCGYCGAAIVGQNSTSRRRPDGVLLDGHRRLRCTGECHGPGCKVAGSCSVAPIERALLGYCGDALNLAALLDGGDQGQTTRGAIAAARRHQADDEHRLERVSRALLDDDGPAPATILRQVRDLEAAIAGRAEEIARLERDLAAIARHDAPALTERWSEVSHAAADLDPEARLIVRQLVADTFERLVVWHSGVDGAGRVIELAMLAKGGGGRLLMIHRRTGEILSDWDWGAPGEADLDGV